MALIQAVFAYTVNTAKLKNSKSFQGKYKMFEYLKYYTSYMWLKKKEKHMAYPLLLDAAPNCFHFLNNNLHFSILSFLPHYVTPTFLMFFFSSCR